jgi:ribonuclease HII
MIFPTFKIETEKLAQGFTLVAGCDEVGRGPLAGPVVAAAVILNPSSVSGRRSKTKWWARVRDSKTTSEKERQTLALFIEENCLARSVGTVSHETIDELNIHNAALSAMKLAVDGLTPRPNYLLVDGRHIIKGIKDFEQMWVVDGDAKVLSIAAASIIAKVARDNMLNDLHEQYPSYGFKLNKGYSTKFHREALRRDGPCPVHRKSFGLVKQLANIHHNQPKLA